MFAKIKLFFMSMLWELKTLSSTTDIFLVVFATNEQKNTQTGLNQNLSNNRSM